MATIKKLEHSQAPPCSPGCWNHLTHPCERCGRVGGYPPGSVEARNVMFNTMFGFLLAGVVRNGYDKVVFLTDSSVEFLNRTNGTAAGWEVLDTDVPEWQDKKINNIDVQFVASMFFDAVLASGAFDDNDEGEIAMKITWRKNLEIPEDLGDDTGSLIRS